MLDLVIKNGKIVNSDETIQADIGIKDGKIACLGKKEYFSEASREIDASNKLVMPGLVDSHVHVALELGEFTSLDDFENASIAAAYGGTTSMVEFAIPVGDETPMNALEHAKDLAKGKSVIDYSFHGCVTRADEVSLQNVEDMLTDGISSIKMFTIYRDLVMLDLMGIIDVLKLVRKHSGIAKIHAENAEIIEKMIEDNVSMGRTTPYYHAKSRPSYSETSAVAKMIPIIGATEAPTIFVHMTSCDVSDYIWSGKQNFPVYTEFCPHYLLLTEDVYERDDAQNFVCSPPMRSQENQDGLWEMIDDDLCDMINSDHSSYDSKQKELHKDNFPAIPNGLPGIETRGLVMFSEGVMKGRFSENKFVELLSTNVAKLMGMYPEKGIIAPGADADVVIFDPSIKYELKVKNIHMATDYTPFEGMNLIGKPTHTIVSGHVVINDQKYVKDSFRGKFMKRHSPELY